MKRARFGVTVFLVLVITGCTRTKAYRPWALLVGNVSTDAPRVVVAGAICGPTNPRFDPNNRVHESDYNFDCPNGAPVWDAVLGPQQYYRLWFEPLTEADAVRLSRSRPW